MKTEIVETQKINKEIKFPCIVRNKQFGDIYMVVSPEVACLLHTSSLTKSDRITSFTIENNNFFEILDEITITFKNE